ncbi:branched-chain amino acid ABC transporter permease [Oscillospiraceae bacterium Marseille-Q3528]|nr:branched-chain amino acid ABC transporter permease [Oscillospiraceae bacterium Marseille-Q3528]
MKNLLEQLINGLSTGSIYALIALGYTMVYGIAKMINFAHGDIIMVGAYALYVAVLTLHVPVIPAVLITIAVCAVLGITVEKVAYKPLRKAPPLAVLITAIGVSYLLQNLALLIFNATPIPFQSVIKVPSVKIGGLTISGITLVTMAIMLISMILLTLFINKTKAGSAMRAVSEDKGAAELMGINVNQTISMTFAIGSALAAVAGILYICQYQSLRPTLGALPGIKAFVAAVLGGIGSVPGAMLGGILLGVIESLGKAYISTELSDAIVFGVLVVVLLVKPSGLLGKRKKVKV